MNASVRSQNKVWINSVNLGEPLLYLVCLVLPVEPIYLFTSSRLKHLQYSALFHKEIQHAGNAISINQFTVNLFPCIKSTFWFKGNEFSGGHAVWLKLWWAITVFIGVASHKKVYREDLNVCGNIHSSTNSHTATHTHTHTHTHIHLTYALLFQYLWLHSSTHFGLFCNFKDRFPGDHKNHYITFTLLRAEMVCVWECAYMRGYVFKKRSWENQTNVCGVCVLNKYLSTHCAELDSTIRRNKSKIVKQYSLVHFHSDVHV